MVRGYTPLVAEIVKNQPIVDALCGTLTFYPLFVNFTKPNRTLHFNTVVDIRLPNK